MIRQRKASRAGAWARAVVCGLILVTQVQAQDAPVVADVPLAPILTLDQDRFFLESDFGRAALARERDATTALEQENKRIEAELVAEEQALTEQRKTLSPEEFTAKADAFDSKVERIRAEQDAKALALTAARDKDRTAFLQAAVPVLGALLGEKQATAIFDKSQVIVALSAIDITDEAIAKVNAALATPTDAP
jgi:Skp family chaperone for outer membrane proteins